MDGTIAAELLAVRRERGLTKSEMVRLLQRYGLPRTTFATYRAWEAGVEPKPAYAAAIRRALGRIRRRRR